MMKASGGRTCGCRASPFLGNPLPPDLARIAERLHRRDGRRRDPGPRKTSGRVTVKDMQDHIAALLKQHEIQCYFVKRLHRRRSRAFAVREFSEIQIPPVRSLPSYATALHEIGHVIGRYQSSKRVMVRELWAWRWAKSHALVWSPARDRDMTWCMDWYAKRAKKLDAEWAPPEMTYGE
jgi:hypothetical protein